MNDRTVASLNFLNLCVTVMCSLMVYLMSSPWSSPWLWKRLPSRTQYTCFKYWISKDTHRCSSLYSTPLIQSLLLFLTSLQILSLTLSWVLLLIDLSPFNHPNFFSSSLPSLITLLHCHPLCLSISFLARHLFNFLPAFIHSPFVLSCFVQSRPPSPSHAMQPPLKWHPTLLFHSPSFIFMCVPWWNAVVPPDFQ